jgi:hypothetical protein
MGLLSANSANSLSTIVVASIAASPLLAAPPATWTPDKAFPDYYQKDPAVNMGDCACAPVAATDSLFWLASKYNLPKLIKGVTWQQLTNTLESNKYMNTNGTTYAGNFADGKQKYINDVGYNKNIVQRTKLGGSKDPPTLDFIKSEVAAGEDVEMLVLWMKNGANKGDPAIDVGGHWVAVTGYDQNNLLVADPWNNNNSNSDKVPITGTMDTIFNFDSYGKKIANYTQNYVTVTINDGLTFAGSQYEIAFAAVSESPAPEPSTWALLATGLIGLGSWRRLFARGRASQGVNASRHVVSPVGAA